MSKYFFKKIEQNPKLNKESHLLINLIYIVVFYIIFVSLFFLIDSIGLTNLNMYLSIVATILGILSICLAIYFYKETNGLYMDMKEIVSEIKIYTKHIFTKESERVDKFIEKATETVPEEKIVGGKYLG